MAERGQFTFYRSYYTAIRQLAPRDRGTVLMAVCAYALDGEAPELSGVPAAVFELIRPTLDTGRRKAESRTGKTRQRPPEEAGEDAFTAPTTEEVRAYCLERGSSVDPEHFVDYYNSNGWMVGRSKMRNWRAAVRTWERNGPGAAALPPRKRWVATGEFEGYWEEENG